MFNKPTSSCSAGLVLIAAVVVVYTLAFVAAIYKCVPCKLSNSVHLAILAAVYIWQLWLLRILSCCQSDVLKAFLAVVYTLSLLW
jgi:hypothetical protein